MKKYILIIDDDTEFAESMTAVLESGGYEVKFADTSSVGLQKAQIDKPDLIMLDVMMAYDSEGIDIARQLHNDSKTRKIPVVLTTGIRNAKNLPFSLQADESWLPVKKVLEKPVKPEILLQTVSEILGVNE